VGNENWGCGGNYEAESYGYEYRRYATMLRHVDPNAELVVCGHDPSWNKRLTQVLRNHFDLVDHFSIHRYWVSGGPGVAFSEQDYYRSITEAHLTERVVMDTREILREADPTGRVGIALDEWGVWHPEARPWGPGASEDVSGEYSQAATLRDGILAAVALEGFHRQCKLLSLANLAQIVNVLHAPIQTADEHMWVTPTYYVFQLHKPHIGATALPTNTEGGPALPDGSPALTATASRTTDGQAVTVINRHYSEAVEMALPSWAATGQLLTAPHAYNANSAAEPHLVGLIDLAIRKADGEAVAVVPPHSVATIISG
jgi:alpha-N-arabinofuranosidase